MTFLEKYELLKKSIPVAAVTNGHSTTDCEFVDYSKYSKRCFDCFECYELQDGIYDSQSWGKYLVDCSNMFNSEKCYQCDFSNRCQTCTYLFESSDCNDCHYSFLLSSCNDCFGCVDLTHKRYCIFNKQFSKDEYNKKLNEFKEMASEEILEKVYELRKQVPHPASQQFNTVNSPYGNYIYDSKNVYWSFLTETTFDSGYCFFSGHLKKCWDIFNSGGTAKDNTFSELCYELLNSNYCYNCAFLNQCQGCTNCSYSVDLINCTDCFGCVGLKNKKYCILNNQLTKDQFEKAVKEIKRELGWRI